MFLTPKLTKVLTAPERYSPQKIEASVLVEVAMWYRCKEYALLTLGKVSNEPSPAQLAVREVSTAIRGREVRSVEEVKGEFSFHFDNLLLPLVRTLPVLDNKIMTFYYHSFRFFVEQDVPAKTSCPPEDQRLDAFGMAMALFSLKVHSPGFAFTMGASIFFRTIFRRQCLSMARADLTEKEKLNRHALPVQLNQLALKDRALFIVPPIEISEDTVILLRQKFPRCFSLVEKLSEGYQYKELVNTFSKTAEQLRREAYRCREKLMRYYDNLTK